MKSTPGCVEIAAMPVAKCTGAIFRAARNALSCSLAMLLVACGSGFNSSAVQQSRVTQAVGTLDELAGQFLSRTPTPGMAVAVVSHDRVVYMKGFGVRRNDAPDGLQAVDEDTVFQLASMSKAITSTVMAASLPDRTSWDWPVSRLDPAFALADPAATAQLTLRDLLSHRSGLPNGAGDALEGLGYSRDEILRRLRYLPLSGFRTRYNYTNFGFAEAAFALEKYRNIEWESLASLLLYQPLGMRSTSSRYSDYLARPNRAWGHVNVDGVFRSRFERNPDAQSPAGGVSASVRDLTAWVRMLLAQGRFEGRRLIDEDVLTASWEPVIEAGPGSPGGGIAQYALGWNISSDAAGHRLVSHYGAFTTGASTAVVLAPEQQLAIVVLTNAEPVGLAEGLSSAFMELALSGAITRDWLAYPREVFAEYIAQQAGPVMDYSVRPEPNTTMRSLAAYLGEYENPFYGRISAIEQHGELRLLVGPRRVMMDLEHWDGDIFLGTTADADVNDAGGVKFLFADAPGSGGSGEAKRIRLDNYVRHGEGDFVRVE